MAIVKQWILVLIGCDVVGRFTESGAGKALRFNGQGAQLFKCHFHKSDVHWLILYRLSVLPILFSYAKSEKDVISCVMNAYAQDHMKVRSRVNM